MFVLAIAPRRVIRAEHEPVGAAERPATELAAARCLLTTRWFTRAIYIRRNTSFSASKLPSDPARDFAYS